MPTSFPITIYGGSNTGRTIEGAVVVSSSSMRIYYAVSKLTINLEGQSFLVAYSYRLSPDHNLIQYFQGKIGRFL